MHPAELQAFNQAVYLAGVNRKEDAHRLLQNLIGSNPNNTNLLLWLSYTSDNYDEASRYLTQVSLLDPSNPNHIAARTWLNSPQSNLRPSKTAPTVASWTFAPDSPSTTETSNESNSSQQSFKSAAKAILVDKNEEKSFTLRKIKWSVQLEDGYHSLELHHSGITAKNKIYLDGQIVASTPSLVNLRKGQIYDLVIYVNVPYECAIRIIGKSFSEDYNLIINHIELETNDIVSEYAHLRILPGWVTITTLVFWVAMEQIFHYAIIVDLYIGLVMCFCWNVGTNETKSPNTRVGLVVLICLASLILSLFLFRVPTHH